MQKEGERKFKENDSTESLRRILEHQQGRVFTYDEALEIGDSLLSFYELLAEDANGALMG